jgi:ATP-binding cassette subfamily A (ABC1) protein 3
VKSFFYKFLLCIFPNYALNFAIQVVYQYERSSKRFSLFNVYQNLFGEGLTLGFVLTTMVFWSLFYLMFSWYIERIFPGEYGIKLPWNFPFMKSYWFDTYENGMRSSDYLNDANLNLKNDSFEREPSDLYASVKIRNLTKVFDNKKVVDSLSLNFYENQITGFLGHNGAGKTTVTFMLCGLYSPNAGTAYILEHDIRTNLDKIRSSIGFCPQQNILYDDLTIYEHFYLISAVIIFLSYFSVEIFVFYIFKNR